MIFRVKTQTKQFFRSRSCKCGHGLDSHSETGKCTSHIGFADVCPCSSYLNAPVNSFSYDSKYLGNCFSKKLI